MTEAEEREENELIHFYQDKELKLEEEIAELKKEKEYLDKVNNEQTEVILKLNDQIERMKYCGNCKYMHTSIVDFPFGEYPCTNCSNYSNWELADGRRN